MRRSREVLVALALAACAADVESAPGPSLEREDVGIDRMGLSIGGAIPKCKDKEVLCCPNGGPNCTWLPEGHTCTGGFVVSPGFKLAP